MSWFNRKKQPEQTEERSSTFDYLMYNTGANYGTSKAMLLSTVYRCVEVNLVIRLFGSLFRIL